MPIATFRGKVFQVSGNRINTFSGLSWSGSLDTEAQEQVGSKPSTYIRGAELDTLNIDIQLRADLGHRVREEIESWESIRDAKAPDIFVLGAKPIGKNKWLLKSIAVSGDQIDGAGRMLSATIKLTFEEYVRVGTATATTSLGSTLIPNEIYSPTDKVLDARTNQNMLEAIANGMVVE